MKYARYDHVDGSLIGLYDDTVHATLPTRTVTISYEFWRTLVHRGQDYAYDTIGQEWVLKNLTLEAIQKSRTIGERKVDKIAEDRRKDFLTLSGGQDTIYILKYDESVAYLASGGDPEDVDNYIFVKAEWDAMEIVNAGMTPAEVAQAIVDKRNVYVAIGANIERERRAAKERIAIANTKSEIDIIVEYARTQIQEIES